MSSTDFQNKTSESKRSKGPKEFHGKSDKYLKGFNRVFIKSDSQTDIELTLLRIR